MKSRRLRRCLFILLIYLSIEGLILGGMWLLKKTGKAHYDPNLSALSEDQKQNLRQFIDLKRAAHARQDPVLGWVHTAEANSAGMRDDREYPLQAEPGVVRISAFGDSFTYGQDVPLDKSWAKQLSAIDPSIEILNYGVGAYGLDQAYLRYLKVGTEYDPHIVFIGYMSENIARNVNVFRPFYSRAYRDVIFTKPRFSVRDNRLVLLDNPIATLDDHRRFLHNDVEVLRELGVNDYHYQTKYNPGAFDILPSVRLGKIVWHRINTKIVNPIFVVNGIYSTKSEAYDVTLTILDTFYRRVLEKGALPVILIFPDTNDQRRSRDKKVCRYAPLLDDLDSRSLVYIDLLPALTPYESKYTIRDLVVQWGHYSPLGSEIIAGHILSSLRNLELTDPSRIEAAIEAECDRLDVNRQ